MKYIFKSLTILVFSLIFTIACKNESSNNTKKQVGEITNQTITYISNDGIQKFELHIVKDTISLQDITNNKSYKMDYVHSGSGSKYESADGYVFWSKGNEYTFYKNNNTISKGTLYFGLTSKHFGTYVSESYEKRNEGYDWIAVNVSKGGIDKLNISVRSRADKKKPTCSFNVIASKVNENTYKAYENNVDIVFSFQEDYISIYTENKENNDVLTLYCSGGASLHGKYRLIVGNADQSQIDKTQYIKALTWQNISFNISSVRKEYTTQLTITPFGLTNDEATVTHDIEGLVTNAEIEDLNADGFPEVLVYIQSTGSGSYSKVIGYSVNNGKSMSQIYMPPIFENKEINKGYLGHDEFAIMETTFVQRFPIYNDNDTNSNPTGDIRQIQYKLKDGEASRKFVIDKVIEY